MVTGTAGVLTEKKTGWVNLNLKLRVDTSKSVGVDDMNDCCSDVAPAW
jgi:hypothetical protein